MLFIFVHPGIFLVGLFLTIVSVASLASSFVLLNSFLPLLVANHSSISQNQEFHSVQLDNVDSVSEDSDGEEEEDDDDDDDTLDNEGLVPDRLATTALLSLLPQQAITATPGDVSPSLKLSNIISSKGIGIGYAASVLVQVINITIILIYRYAGASGSKFSVTTPLRTVLFLVGFWWAAFTVPTACWLRCRPGTPIPCNVGNKKPKGGIIPGLRYMLFSWVSLWRTTLVAVQLREVLKVLLGWFLLSDGIATITGTAILFAKVELQLGAAAIALLSITATASGIVGALCWPIIGRCWKIKPISILLSCIFLFELIPLCGLLGFVPYIQSLGFLGLQKWWEIYPLGALLGFIMGGISSYARSIFGTLILLGWKQPFTHYTLLRTNEAP
jgi:UMF1 family MFS transporter